MMKRSAIPTLIVASFVVSSLGITGCTKKEEGQANAPGGQKGSTSAPALVTQPGANMQLEVKDEKVGTGKVATKGKTIQVHYTGWLTDGKKFDSSHDRNQPFRFTLGAGQVIPGWDRGIEGMKVGGKRKLTIPSELAYGAHGAGSLIPPNSTLVFDVELVKVE